MGTIKRKRNYEKARREARAGSGLRCEDPLEPAWVHRLSFLYTADASMSADAANLAHVAKGETLALHEIGHAMAFVERQTRNYSGVHKGAQVQVDRGSPFALRW